MAKKEKFIEMVETLLKDMDTDEYCKYQEAIDYSDELLKAFPISSSFL